MVWTRAHATLAEMARMTPESRHVAWVSEKADELAKTGAIKDGAEMSEQIF